jgi:hypothetical protein
MITVYPMQLYYLGFTVLVTCLEDFWAVSMAVAAHDAVLARLDRDDYAHEASSKKVQHCI